METAYRKELAKQIAKDFIQRRDVYAGQNSQGHWRPVRDRQDDIPIGLRAIEQHLDAEHSIGHYLLDQSDNTRVITFDIDLRKDTPEPKLFMGSWVNLVDPADETTWEYKWADAREAWRDRSHASRPWIKNRLMMLARTLAYETNRLLGCRVAVAYTGNKGVHVYGFIGQMPASHARAGAQLVMESIGGWESSGGKNFYYYKDQDDHFGGNRNFSIEVFPKQDSIGGDGYGNLVALPLGKNRKSPDPKFFIDLTAPFGEMVATKDPLAYLIKGAKW